MIPADLPPRMAAKVAVDESGCWLWTAGRNNSGYGKVSWMGGYKSTHRVTYTLLVGPIPDGLQIDHLCRNRACCNPSHLEPVTALENQLRSPYYNAREPRPERTPRTAATHCGQGHALTPEDVYIVNGRRRCKACHIRRQREYRKRKST